MIAVTAAGIYFCVPDTEQARVAYAVLGVLALAGWPLRLGSLGWIGSLALTGVSAWIAAVDGIGRPPSIIGAVACLGMFLVEPSTREVLRLAHDLSDFERRSRSIPSWLIFAVHLAVVAVASRVAGRFNRLAPAAAVVAAELVIAALVVGIISYDAALSQPG